MQMQIELILEAAHLSGCQALVLSALGCGAFGNPPWVVARLFREALLSHASSQLRRVVFCILDDHNSGHSHNPEGNFRPFAETLKAPGAGSSRHRKGSRAPQPGPASSQDSAATLHDSTRRSTTQGSTPPPQAAQAHSDPARPPPDTHPPASAPERVPVGPPAKLGWRPPQHAQARGKPAAPPAGSDAPAAAPGSDPARHHTTRAGTAAHATGSTRASFRSHLPQPAGRRHRGTRLQWGQGSGWTPRLARAGLDGPDSPGKYSSPNSGTTRGRCAASRGGRAACKELRQGDRETRHCRGQPGSPKRTQPGAVARPGSARSSGGLPCQGKLGGRGPIRAGQLRTRPPVRRPATGHGPPRRSTATFPLHRHRQQHRRRIRHTHDRRHRPPPTQSHSLGPRLGPRPAAIHRHSLGPRPAATHRPHPLGPRPAAIHRHSLGPRPSAIHRPHSLGLRPAAIHRHRAKPQRV